MPDGAPDPNAWRFNINPDVPGWNNERQGYTNSSTNARIENGKLVLQAIRQPYNYPNDPEQRHFSFTSARLDTKDRFAFRYGKLEASIKLPSGGGAWPAFWLLSASEKYTKALNPTPEQTIAQGFYSHDGEIDIMESAANDGCKIYATVHTFATYRQPKSGQTQVPGCTSDFQTYALEWHPDSLIFSVNGQPYHTVTKTSDDPDIWPFDQPMYIILNLALGGTMGGEISPSTSLWHMEVRRIAYYPYLK